MLLHHKNLMNNAFAKHNRCGVAVENISLPLFGNNILHLEKFCPIDFIPRRGWSWESNLCRLGIAIRVHQTLVKLEGMVWNYACFLAVLLLPGLWEATESTREVKLLSITSCPSLPRSILSCFMSGGRTSFLPFSWAFHSHSALAQTCFFSDGKKKITDQSKDYIGSRTTPVPELIVRRLFKT